LAHEPLLQKFREFKTFMRKIRNAAGRNQPAEARRKNASKPQFILDHLVKERYPRFVDALRDMDDALCMVHLFAALPSVGRVTATKTATCQELVRHWQFYVARSKALRKVFVSVKGVYFQCDVMGEMITWLAPHSFAQKMPKDVDFRVMITFLDFYEVFLRFALFKLYTMMGLSYPPKVDTKLRDAGSFLLAVKPLRIDGGDAVEEGAAAVEKKSNGTQAVVDNAALGLSKKKMHTLESKLASLAGGAVKNEEEDEEEEEDDEEEDADITQPLTDAFDALHGTKNGEANDDGIDEQDAQVFAEGGEEHGGSSSLRSSKDESVRLCASLFKGAVFFVNREVPMELLQLCIASFGGVMGWDGPDSPYQVNDVRITHQIVDRPVQGEGSAGREYIQPQWVFDSINAQLQLPVHRYRPGQALPPHLSPFVDDDKEGYVPAYREDILKLQSASGVGGVQKEQSGDEDEEGAGDSDEDSDAEYERELQAEKAGVSYSSAQKKKDDSDSEEEEEEDSEEEEEEEEEPAVASKGHKAIVYEPSNDVSCWMEMSREIYIRLLYSFYHNTSQHYDIPYMQIRSKGNRGRKHRVTAAMRPRSPQAGIAIMVAIKRSSGNVVSVGFYIFRTMIAASHYILKIT
jgi:pescadillo